MQILGSLLKKGIRIRESLIQEYSTPAELQKQELRYLLIQAQGTKFGQQFDFRSILKSFKNNKPSAYYQMFIENVPLFDYQKMNEEWWSKAREGQENVSWPGRVNYFALSSGTSDAATKYLPITMEMIKSIRKTSIRQILTLSKYEDLPDTFFSKGILMLGGSTHLNQRGSYFEGDLSGINASQLPFWFQHFYKPGKRISKEKDWSKKLDEITKKAKDWDIGIIVGVPAWIQLLMEKIIDYYDDVQTIHDVWPNLRVYTHGGVSFKPYKSAFKKLLGKPIYYIETYLASEGFIAFQDKPNTESMKLVLNNGIFFEFIPFNDDNFDAEGNIKKNAQVYHIGQVTTANDYAILLSTNAGAWRYLIGDTVRFTDVENAELIITGRTKHFLSLCGEHLSVDNMTEAIKHVSNDLQIDIKEFCVAGVPSGSLFGHHWFVGTNDTFDQDKIEKLLDAQLKILNEDYKVERTAALKHIEVTILPTQAFYEFLRQKGKEGGQHKFPRVIKGSQFEEWKSFIKNNFSCEKY